MSSDVIRCHPQFRQSNNQGLPMPQSPFERQLLSDSFQRIMTRFQNHQAEVLGIQKQYEQNQEELALCWQFTEEADSSLNAAPKVVELISFWYKILGTRHPVAEDLYSALYRQFVGKIILEDAADFQALGKRPRLYLANHQVGIESILFLLVVSVLSDGVTKIVAKIEHRQSWMSQLFQQIYSYPQIKDPELIFYFQRDDPLSMLKLLRKIKKAIAEQQHSLLVHVQGTRSLSCRQEVTDLSAVFIDLALELNLPLVPVNFRGGLPVEPLTTRLEFPSGYSTQDYHLGKAIYPDTLKALGNLERKALIIQRLNQLGGEISSSFPHPPEPNFARKVQLRIEHTGVSEIKAVLYQVLEGINHPTSEVRTLLTGIRQGFFQVPHTPEGLWLQEFGKWLGGNP